MYRAVWRILVTAAFMSGAFFAWQHLRQTPAGSVAAEQKAEANSENAEGPEAKIAHDEVAIRGPLADYVMGHQPSAEEAPSAPHKPSPEDRIEDSPVGTTLHILHKTFTITRILHVPFEIPPHAVTPRFHGTFQSFVEGESSHDDSANVDMLLMNETQYAQFTAGRDPDVLFIADTSHYQEINYDLSRSRDQPVRYHLVFRSTPGGAAKKVVKADFSVDF